MTRRRKRFLIVAVIIFLGLIAVQSTMFVRPRREIRIEVVGTPGQSIAASFKVDGKRHEESRQLPTNFLFQARDISFSMIPENSRYESNLTVKAYIGDDDKRERLFVRRRLSTATQKTFLSRPLGVTHPATGKWPAVWAYVSEELISSIETIIKSWARLGMGHRIRPARRHFFPPSEVCFVSENGAP